MLGNILTWFTSDRIIAVATVVYALVTAVMFTSIQSQARTVRRQSFENKFFQLLRLHHAIVEDTYEARPFRGASTSGRDAFRWLYNAFLNYYNTVYRERHDPQLGQVVDEAYQRFYREHQHQLGHYFRNLYYLIKFIDRQQLAAGDKAFYTHLVRAQMSSNELLLLFYNCSSSLGKEKFYPLVVKYSLLENMPRADLASPHFSVRPKGADHWWVQVPPR